MSLLSRFLRELYKFRAHSLGFYGRGNSVMVMAKTDVNKGQTLPLMNMSTIEYYRLFDEIFSNSDSYDFQRDKQFINIDIESEEIESFGFSHITVTQQPLSLGQFASAITTHLSESHVSNEEYGSELPGIHKNPSNIDERFEKIEKDAEEAEQIHLENLMKTKPFWLSNKDLCAFGEFEIRLEPLILHDERLEGGGYNPFWGWWQF